MLSPNYKKMKTSKFTAVIYIKSDSLWEAVDGLKGTRKAFGALAGVMVICNASQFWW